MRVVHKALSQDYDWVACGDSDLYAPAKIQWRFVTCSKCLKKRNLK